MLLPSRLLHPQLQVLSSHERLDSPAYQLVSELVGGFLLAIFDASTYGKKWSFVDVSFWSQLEVLERREGNLSNSMTGAGVSITTLLIFVRSWYPNDLKQILPIQRSSADRRSILNASIQLAAIMDPNEARSYLRFSCDRLTFSRIRLGYLRNMILHQNTNAWSFSILPHHA